MSHYRRRRASGLRAPAAVRTRCAAGGVEAVRDSVRALVHVLVQVLHGPDRGDDLNIDVGVEHEAQRSVVRHDPAIVHGELASAPTRGRGFGARTVARHAAVLCKVVRRAHCQVFMNTRPLSRRR